MHFQSRLSELGGRKKKMIADSGAAVVVGLLAVQCGMGAYIVFSSNLLAAGFSPIFLIFVISVTAAVIALPFALAFERQLWPERVTASLCAQLVAVALLGTVMFQELMSLGLERTAPAVNAAMLNLVPAVVFLIAVCLRLEKLELRCKYTWAKLLGTAVCVAGVSVISIMQSSSHSGNLIPSTAGDGTGKAGYVDWAVGCLLLVAGILAVSSSSILQAIVLESLPAPLTVCVICWTVSALACLPAQLILEGRVRAGGPGVTGKMIALAAGAGGVFQAVYTWMLVYSMSKKGPVFISMFGPVSAVSAAAIAAALLRQAISAGSLVGSMLVFTGLYIFLWGKINEQSPPSSSSQQASHDQHQKTGHGIHSQDDIEASEPKIQFRSDLQKPLLLP